MAGILNLLWINGRYPRWQYWAYSLGSWIFLVGSAMLIAVASSAFLDTGRLPEFEELPLMAQVLFFACCILFLWFQVCVEVKRWHDRAKSGWWYFLAFIPIVGPLWTFAECGFRRGTVGENRFGPNPLLS